MIARHAALLGVLTSLSFASSCAGDLKSPNRFSKLLGASDAGPQQHHDATMSSQSDAGVKTAPACVAQAFRNSCGASDCHSKGTQQVDLVSEGVAERLIDKPSRNATCKGRTFVATDGSASLIAQKLAEKPPCGVQMPIDGTISAEDKTCLFDWVISVGGSVPDAGAP